MKLWRDGPIQPKEYMRSARGVDDKITPITPRGRYMRRRTIWEAYQQGRLTVVRTPLGHTHVTFFPKPDRYRVQDTETGKWLEIHLRDDQELFIPITEEAFAILSAAPKPTPIKAKGDRSATNPSHGKRKIDNAVSNDAR